MGRKNVLRKHLILSEGDMSGDLTSDVTSCRNLDQILIRCKWSNGASPVGEIFVDIAHYNDETGQYDDFVALDFSSSIAVSGNSGYQQIHLGMITWDVCRVRYDFTSGTGDLDISIFGKDLGA